MNIYIMYTFFDIWFKRAQESGGERWGARERSNAIQRLWGRKTGREKGRDGNPHTHISRSTAEYMIFFWIVCVFLVHHICIPSKKTLYPPFLTCGKSGLQRRATETEVVTENAKARLRKRHSGSDRAKKKHSWQGFSETLQSILVCTPEGGGDTYTGNKDN